MKLLLIFLTLFSHLAWGGSNLVYGELTRLDSFDPYTAHEESAHRFSELVFNSLVAVDHANRYVADLAESWVTSPSGRSVTFTLRKGIKWHDGRDLIPKDVVQTVRMLLDRKQTVRNRNRFAVLKGAKALSNNRVAIQFNRRVSDALKYTLFKILPAHHFIKNRVLSKKHSFTSKPIGTGPYMFDSVNSYGEVLLKKNESYFAGKLPVEKIAMKPFADAVVMAQSLMFQSIDLITYVSPRSAKEIESDANLTVVPYDGLSFSFIAINNSKPYLKDKRVRQALAYAINRKEMLESFYQSKGHLISGPFAPHSWAYNVEVAPLEYDLNRSKNLLSEAGYKADARGNLRKNDRAFPKLKFLVPVSGNSEMTKRVVVACQNYLKKVGIELDIEFRSWTVWKQRVLKDHDYDLTVASWGFDDANNIKSLFHSSESKPWGNNFVVYKNASVDSLLAVADETNDLLKMRSIYMKLHALIAEDVPYIFLWSLSHQAAHTKKIAGLNVTPLSFFQNIKDWKVEN